MYSQAFPPGTNFAIQYEGQRHRAEQPHVQRQPNAALLFQLHH